MNIKTKIAILSLALVGAGAAAGYSKVSAFGPFGTNGDTMIKSLSQKLGLSEDKVKTAFDQLRDERQATMQKTIEDRLTQAVKDGKLTEAQKQLVLAKHKELQAKHEADFANQNLTPTERRAKMATERAELEAWAKQNKIDISYIGFGLGKMGGMGGGRHMMGR